MKQKQDSINNKTRIVGMKGKLQQLNTTIIVKYHKNYEA